MVIPLGLQLFTLYACPVIGIAVAFRRPSRSARGLILGGAVGGAIGGALLVLYEQLVISSSWMDSATRGLFSIILGMLLGGLAVAVRILVRRVRTLQRPGGL